MNVASKALQLAEPNDDFGYVSEVTEELKRIGFNDEIVLAVTQTIKIDGLFTAEAGREAGDDSITSVICQAAREIERDFRGDANSQMAAWFLFFIGFRGPFGICNQGWRMLLDRGGAEISVSFLGYRELEWVKPFKWINWNEALPKVWQNHHAFGPFLYYYVRPLLRFDLMVDFARLDSRFWTRAPLGFNDPWMPKQKLNEIEYWLHLERTVAFSLGELPPDGGVLGQSRAILASYEAESFANMGVNLLKLLDFMVFIFGETQIAVRGFYAPELMKWAELATTGLASNKHPGFYRIAWLCCSYAHDCIEMDDSERRALVLAAREVIGKMRSVVRINPDTANYDALQDASLFLFYFAEPWELAKPLLLMFADLRRPVLANDLRNWNEAGKDSYPDLPEGVVVQSIINAMVSPMSPGVKKMLEKDPKMMDLRTEFAIFCLERLKTRDAAASDKLVPEDFVEPRVWWRRCYLRAFAELHVSPKGKAHQLLHWLEKHDPDEAVRKFAGEAYRATRQQIDLPPGKSPRRAILSAFWWLQQAHLLELGVQIDTSGAQRTRAKQLRRYADMPMD